MAGDKTTTHNPGETLGLYFTERISERLLARHWLQYFFASSQKDIFLLKFLTWTDFIVFMTLQPFLKTAAPDCGSTALAL